jgi:hypothetical protein
MSPSGAIAHFGPCAASDHDNTTVNQNLGASQAAFALYSALLQQALLSGDYDKMSVDVRMAALDNAMSSLSSSRPSIFPNPSP